MPVYSTHQLNIADLRLGARLRAARNAQQKTLQQLAKASGISAGRLSELENDRRPLELEQVWAITGALGLSLTAILQESVLPYQIVRADAPQGGNFRHIVGAGTDGRIRCHPNRVYLLADRFIGRHFEPLRIRTEPQHERTASILFSHHEQEFLCVLQGRIEFLLDTPAERVRIELSKGDTIFFWSCLPHLARALDGTPAETLNIWICSPIFPESGPFWLRPPSDSIIEPKLSRAESVGRRMRRLRIATGLSQGELAEQLGIQLNRLKAAEAGTRTLPVAVLMQLSRILSCPLRTITGETARPPYFYVLRSEEMRQQPALRRRRVPRGDNETDLGALFRPLAAGFPERGVFPVLVEITDRAPEEVPIHTHHGEEFIYVFEGRLELSIAVAGKTVTELLRSGDCCYLDSSVPHSVRSYGDNPHSRLTLQALDVFWSPLGEDYLFQPAPVDDSD